MGGGGSEGTVKGSMQDDWVTCTEALMYGGTAAGWPGSTGAGSAVHACCTPPDELDDADKIVASLGLSLSKIQQQRGGDGGNKAGGV